MPIPPKFSASEAINKPNGPATTAGEEALIRLKHISGNHEIAVGLSGGVDSSLTAALLHEAGCQVQGLTLW